MSFSGRAAYDDRYDLMLPDPWATVVVPDDEPELILPPPLPERELDMAHTNRVQRIILNELANAGPMTIEQLAPRVRRRIERSEATVRDNTCKLYNRGILDRDQLVNTPNGAVAPRYWRRSDLPPG